jgi:hypothetical protein
MGAVAVAAAMLVAPVAANAGEEDPALIQFKLPSSAAYADFESLGLNMDHAVENAGDGDAIIVSAWVTDEEKALAEARGYRAVGTVHEKNNIDRIRAERERRVTRGGDDVGGGARRVGLGHAGGERPERRRSAERQAQRRSHGAADGARGVDVRLQPLRLHAGDVALEVGRDPLQGRADRQVQRQRPATRR